MARYILIDNNSGFIWGDSAALDGKIFTGTALEYANALDEHIGLNAPRKYTERSSDPRSTIDGYHVYRADVRGSEAVPVVWDGQSKDTIEAVERGCEYVGFIETADAE